MTTEVRAPTFPESISEGTIAGWRVAVGDMVARDTVLVEVETDKVVIEVVAPARGCITEQLKLEGDTVLSEELIGRFEAAATGVDPARVDPGPVNPARVNPAGVRAALVSGAVAAPATAMPNGAGPAARKAAAEHGVTLNAVAGSGRGGRVTKADIERAGAVLAPPGAPEAVPETAIGSAGAPPVRPVSVVAAPAAGIASSTVGNRIERRVPMTRLRASIAKRLVEAQRNAAMLTTFNEVNMAPVNALRERYKEAFAARHDGARLGYMSFFVRASVEALKRFPAVNASIDGEAIVYHGYHDIGVAVSSERGLVVPVLRDADGLGMAQIEAQIRDLGVRARDNKLTLQDMSGGTFTISNGGVFGSLLSTPILNPPQTAILGLHKVQDRPVADNGQVVIRPMMYLALSYDHRVIDGSEAVRFLVTIKEIIEDPMRILLEV